MAERTKSVGMAKGLSFSADGRQLAVGAEEGTITVLEWPSLARKSQWQASPKAIRNVDFSAPHGDRVIAAVDESGGCTLWAVDTAEAVARLEPPAGEHRAGIREGAGGRADANEKLGSPAVGAACSGCRATLRYAAHALPGLPPIRPLTPLAL
jgi:hypothetical protein